MCGIVAAVARRNVVPILIEGLKRLNGIIENHDEVRARLRGQGYEFSSDTDTEVIAQRRARARPPQLMPPCWRC